MPLNFDLAGKTYEPVTLQISADSIEAYAAASRIDNPQHHTGSDQVPSIVFPVVIGLGQMNRVTSDPELRLDNPLMIVHGEHDIVHHRPMRPGESLVFSTTAEFVEDKGRNATYTAKVTATTPDGEMVNEQRGLMFVRGGGSGQERPAGERRQSPARGEQVASFTVHVDAGMPAEYAVASGDLNPIHVDPAVATAVGLPGVINHGLGTLSIVSGGLVREVADGDAARVRRIQVRFTDMVIPGSDLSTAVWKSAGSGFLFETTRPDGNVVMTGLLELNSA